MSWLRLIVLGCFILGLVGCSGGKKDKAKASRAAQTSPAYSWQRPADNLPPPEPPPKKPGERDPF